MSPPRPTSRRGSGSRDADIDEAVLTVPRVVASMRTGQVAVAGDPLGQGALV